MVAVFDGAAQRRAGGIDHGGFAGHRNRLRFCAPGCSDKSTRTSWPTCTVSPLCSASLKALDLGVNRIIAGKKLEAEYAPEPSAAKARDSSVHIDNGYGSVCHGSAGLVGNGRKFGRS